MFYLLKLNFDHSMNDAVKRNFPMTRVSDPVFLHGSGSGFQISLDPDPVCPERLDPDQVCPEKLDPDPNPDPVNIRPDPKPCSRDSP